MKRRTFKTCSEPKCPTLTDHPSGKCDTHLSASRAVHDAARPSSARRGYGRTHQQARASLAPSVATGTVACARCGELIDAGELWDLGHDDNDRSRYTGPEHARCNRATKTHAAQRMAS